MDLKDFFSSAALEQVAQALKTNTSDNQICSREKLASSLGLYQVVTESTVRGERSDNSSANSRNQLVCNILSMLVRENVVPGYTVQMGKGGGFASLDKVAANKADFDQQTELVKKALNELLPTVKYQIVSRENVAKKAFGDGSVSNCALVSKAVHSEALKNEFEGVKGPHGGICRKDLRKSKKALPKAVKAQTEPVKLSNTPTDMSALSDEEKAEVAAAAERERLLNEQFPEE